MRYGFWLPVFGGWLRNIDDEHMPATWDYVRDARAQRRRVGLRLHPHRRAQPQRHQGPRSRLARRLVHRRRARRRHQELELMVAVRPTFHNPALLAKQAANIDRISNGRLTLNVVSSWWRDEALKYGIPFDEHDDRYARTAEWLDVLTQLLAAATHHPLRPLLQHRRQHPLPQTSRRNAPTPARPN